MRLTALLHFDFEVGVFFAHKVGNTVGFGAGHVFA